MKTLKDTRPIVDGKFGEFFLKFIFFIAMFFFFDFGFFNSDAFALFQHLR